ncbi:cell wall-binding repeat-containing protein [Desulfitobacterium metallireducens]|uniref:Amidase n=1 Tax=Desulfitobacterium metallireducens DSM 15288 TaxID=871968 RepID=W0EFK1_9FIRM|nr:cell wall-binding repeat-containing protein [Desulfitobacterium metallireducens]AHF07979.1 amidase [Desulfitobacterium metallireducens DSM 15288]
MRRLRENSLILRSLSCILVFMLAFGVGLTGMPRFAQAAGGNTYYVAQRGNDPNQFPYGSGTIEDPYPSIGRAMDYMKPGDTLIIRGGTYNELIDLYSKKGSPDAWFTVKAYPGEKVVLDGQNKLEEGIIFNTSSYWRIEGIEFTGYTGAALYIKDQCNHFDLNNLLIHDLNGPVGTNAGTEGIMGEKASYITVRNSEIYNVGLAQKKQTDHGIYVGYGAHHWTFDGNIIHNNSGAAIQMIGEPNGASNCTVTNNYLYDNLQWGLVMGSHATGNDVENNTFFGNYDSDVYLLYNANGNTFRNNIFGSYDAKFSVAISDNGSTVNSFDANTYRKSNDRVVFQVTDNITFSEWQGNSQEPQGQYINAPLSEEEKIILKASGKDYTSKRLSGLSRYSTATSIAQEINNGTVDQVLIASALNFPDALSGSVLAYQKKAPILLAGPTPAESQDTLEYVKNHLSPSGTIYLLGGVGAVADSFRDSFKEMGYSENQIKRLSGDTRYGTNQAINGEISAAKGTPVVIASGEGFADALSISSIAAAKGYPILLTMQNELPEETIMTLEDIQPSKVFVVGGTGAVTESVRAQLQSLTGLSSDNVPRIWGNSRYATSLSIAQAFEFSGDTVTFAYGENFPDALAGSVLAAKLDAPIVLISQDNWLEAKRFADRSQYTNQIIFGGSGVIGDSLKNQLMK